ncbi:butyrophilin subfamily 1 member A1-like [Notamacropus eugenii]|uniref:butyrophilin subfamily 1 member A1-like n=1 Tax=Notamacropus eugenii TaxID=9315 RepID=UPI003B66FF0D
MLNEAGIIIGSLLLLTIMPKEKLHTELAKLKVICPTHTIVARLGEDVTLSCHLSPETSAEHMKVKWFQVQLSPSVLMDQDMVDMTRNTTAGNKRTLLMTHAVNKGIGTLKIFHVDTSDSGQYWCRFEQDGVHREASLELKVAEPPPLGMTSSWKILLTLGLFLLIATTTLTWNKYYRKVNSTLDSKTANPELIFSEKGTCVTRGSIRQNLPDNPQRFKFLPSVLGKEKITSGRHSWEVEAGHGSGWFLGICREDVSRKGGIRVTPENGFWVMGCYGNEYWAITSPPTLLSLRVSPHRIGIFLDYHLGLLSFQNAMDGSHIHTFQATPFSGTLRPFFLLWSPDCKDPSGMLHRLEKANRTIGHKSNHVPSLRNPVTQQTSPLATRDQDPHLTSNFLLSPKPTPRQSIWGPKRYLVKNPVTFLRIPVGISSVSSQKALSSQVL